MRRLILPLAAALAALSVHRAEAGEVRRIIVTPDAIPWQAKSTELKAAQVNLPGGAKDYGAIPASWKGVGESDGAPHAKCLDGRTGSVEGFTNDAHRATTKIFTVGDKVFMDEADVEIAEGKTYVKSGTRRALAKVGEPFPGVVLWAFRIEKDIVFVSAIDDGQMTHGFFGYGCSIGSRRVSLGTETFSFVSSVGSANDILKQMRESGDGTRQPGMPGSWSGIDYTVRGSVSRSSSDASPLVSLLVRAP
jgi:hypothetical protein